MRIKQKNWLSRCLEYRYLPILLGIFAVFASFIPAIVLGADSYVGIHDQMDGEILVYITRARNFLKSSFPEFMNGMNANSLTPPSYGSLLLYLLLPPFPAFLVNYIFTALVAFVGMYLFLDTILEQKWLSAVVALLFSQLPFYSVYGLSVMGQPLLFYACIRLWNGKKPWISILITGFFAAFSSLVLVGYADFALLCAFSLIMQLRKQKNAKFAWLQTAVLLFVYVLPNLPLLFQILAPTDVVSHKSTWVASGTQNIRQYFEESFLQGHYHVPSLHTTMIPWVFAAAVAGLLFYGYWNREEKHRLFGLLGFLGAAIAIATCYTLWHSTPIVNLRNQLGGVFITFQVDRVYWLYPAVWYVLLALTIWLLLRLARRSMAQKIIAWLCILLVICPVGNDIYTNSTFYKNAKKIVNNKSFVSWDDFYSPELFQTIEDYIGLPQEEYKVGSVGLYPSVPLYNGFYCIDGYSNNYDLKYKEQFRKIISKELEKKSDIKQYYDDWGNRCYIFSAELGRKYYFDKDSSRVIENLELSAEALKELDCDYIFSGVEIKNPQDSGLEYVENFTDEDSPYRIYLYRVV